MNIENKSKKVIEQVRYKIENLWIETKSGAFENNISRYSVQTRVTRQSVREREGKNYLTIKIYLYLFD